MSPFAKFAASLPAIALAFSFTLSLSSCAGFAEQSRTRALAIDTSIDPTSLADGVYTGRFAYSNLEYTATVTIADARIADISVVANKEAPRESRARPLIDAVRERNSLAVDVVAGATTSSKAILKSIESALKSAPGR